jgi:hypothetical protein
MPPIDPTGVQGGWLHAHEEDTPGQMVFRRSTARLPPARGRRGYDFRPDGTVTVIGSGPTDRSVAAAGSWALGSEGRLTIRLPGQSSDQVLEVISADKDRLVVRK